MKRLNRLHVTFHKPDTTQHHKNKNETMQNEIKERPILFSAPMVQGIQEGRKGMTRRANGLGSINENPSDWEFNWYDYHVGWCFNRKSTLTPERVADRTFEQCVIKCPYGKPGDRLWAKETFYAYGRWIKQFSATKNRDEWFFQDMTTLEGKMYQYSDSPPGNVEQKRVVNAVGWHKRPSLFMPYFASRILLEITDVRVEQLQDISEADAILEGVMSEIDGEMEFFYDYSERGDEFTSARESFKTLWQSINGPESWEQNPFVWVIEFKRIAP